MWPVVLSLWLALQSQTAQAQTDAFEFIWTDSAAQCGVYDLTWSGGSPPFTAFFVPIEGQPIVHQMPDSAFSGGSGSYRILHQFAEDTPYVVYMSDANGDGTGGSSVVAVTGSGPSSCELTSSTNHTTQYFSFNASGEVNQCGDDFHLDWDYAEDMEPYNVSIVPLDQSFRTFSVRMNDASNQGSINWVVNLQAGIKFTVMFNDASGYGAGGTGGIYQVALSSDMPSNCGLILAANNAPLPSGLTTDSLPAAPSSTGTGVVTASSSRSGSPTSSAGSGSGSSSSDLSGGAIAGIVIGVLAGLALLLLLLFCLYKRRKNRDSERLPEFEGKAEEGSMRENRNSTGTIPIPSAISRNLTYGHGHSRNTSNSAPQLANFGGFEQSEVPQESQPTVEPFVPGPFAQSPPHSPMSSNMAALSHADPDSERRRSKLAMSMSSQPTFRVSNEAPENQEAMNRRSTLDLSSHEVPEDDATTTYRRLTDGGRYPNHPVPGQGGRTVDLPPLYNDIPREEEAEQRR